MIRKWRNQKEIPTPNKHRDPLRAVSILKEMGHTMVSTTKSSSVTLHWQMEPK